MHEFAENRLQLRPLDQTGQLEVILSTALQIRVFVPCLFDQVTGPHRLLLASVPAVARVLQEDSEGDVDGCRGEE